jgi:putative membrane protein
MAENDTLTNLSVDRTRLSYERTTMSWVRTAISLITFGFSIYKFAQIETVAPMRNPAFLASSNNFSLLMIVIGLITLLIAVLDGHSDLKALRAQFPGIHVPFSRARILAVLVAILGILALLDVIFRS